MAAEGKPTAASKVWSTTELLESILLPLPPQDLLLSSNVCRQFRAVVRGSINIKKRLFISPGSATDTSTFNEWHIIPYDRNGKPKSNRHNSPNLFEHDEIAINPLILQDLDFDQLPSLAELAAATPSRGKKKQIILFLNPDLLLSHNSASCRDMFITQPPREVEVLDVEFGSLWAWDGEPRPKSMRKFGKGKTVGELIDGVREVVEKGERLMTNPTVISMRLICLNPREKQRKIWKI